MAHLVYDLRVGRRSGIYRVGTLLLREILRIQPDLRCSVLVHARDITDLSSRLGPCTAGSPRIIVPDDDELFVRRSPAVRDLAKSADIFLTPNYLVDPDLPVPYIFCIYDLIRFTQPRAVVEQELDDRPLGSADVPRAVAYLKDSSWPDASTDDRLASPLLQYFFRSTRAAAKGAAAVLTFTQAIADQATQFLSRRNGLTVLQPGVDSRTFWKGDVDKVLRDLRELCIQQPYLLYVGSTKPHKRLTLLSTSVEPLLAMGSLVIATTETDRSRRPVGFTHICNPTDETLRILYTGAAAYVSAAEAEGINLPIMEALACGAECITARIATAEELYRSHVHYYPHDAPSVLTDLMRRAFLGDLPQLAPGCVVPSWEAAAGALLDLIASYL